MAEHATNFDMRLRSAIGELTCVLDLLGIEEAKGFPVGTVSTYSNGEKRIKLSSGAWVPYAGPKKATVRAVGSPRPARRAVSTADKPSTSGKSSTGGPAKPSASGAPQPSSPAVDKGNKGNKGNKIKKYKDNGGVKEADPKVVEAAKGALAAIDAEAKQPIAGAFPKNHHVGPQIDNFPEAKKKAEAALKKITGKDLTLEEVAHGFGLPQGFSALMIHCKTSKEEDQVTMQWALFDDKDFSKNIGELHRSIGKDGNGNSYVKHDLMTIKPAYQGNSGIASSINGNALKRYEKWGIDKAKTEAAWVGRYAWPRLGFTYDNPDNVKKNFDTFLDSQEQLGYPKEKIEQLRRTAAELVKEPWKLAKWDNGDRFSPPVHATNNSKLPEGGAPIGKAFLLSTYNSGVNMGYTEHMHIPIDRNDEGYLNAITKTVKPVDKTDEK